MAKVHSKHGRPYNKDTWIFENVKILHLKNIIVNYFLRPVIKYI